MTEAFTLPPVDRVKITILYENMVDQIAPGGGPVAAWRPRGGRHVIEHRWNRDFHGTQKSRRIQ